MKNLLGFVEQTLILIHPNPQCNGQQADITAACPQLLL